MQRIWVPNKDARRDGEIHRDRLTTRRTDRIVTTETSNKRVADSEVAADPGKYYPQWFNPDRSSYLCPEGMTPERMDAYRERLRKVHPGLDVTWHPIRECWQFWIKEPKVTVWWTKGWKRLFMQDPEGENMGLDDYPFVVLYWQEPELFNKARETADAVIDKMQEVRNKEDAEWDQESADRARDIWNFHNRITTAGKGSKVSEMYQ